MNLPPLSSHALLGAAIAVLVGWRVYRRMKLLIGRQRVRVWRLGTTAVFFSLAIVALLVLDLERPTMLEGLAAGGLCGAGLAFVGLRLTRFEVAGSGCAYVPNTAIGLAVSLLFMGRLVYRFVEVWLVSGGADAGALPPFGKSALTLASFALVAAYYATFAGGILWWYRGARMGGAVADAAGTPVA